MKRKLSLSYLKEVLKRQNTEKKCSMSLHHCYTTLLLIQLQHHMLLIQLLQH